MKAPEETPGQTESLNHRIIKVVLGVIMITKGSNW